MRVSIVIPIFNDTSAISNLVGRIIDTTKDTVFSAEIILVDDGSKESSLDFLIKLKERKNNAEIKIIRIQQNKGQAIATFTGLLYSEGDYIVTLDSDLQHPPEEIPHLINSLIENNADLAYGTATEGHTLGYRLIRSPYKFVTTLFRQGNDVDASSFRCMNARTADKLINRADLFFIVIDSVLQNISTNTIQVKTQHDKRKTGKSTYTLAKKIKIALLVITTSRPFYLSALLSSIFLIIFLLLFNNNPSPFLFIIFPVLLAFTWMIKRNISLMRNTIADIKRKTDTAIKI